MKILYVTPYVPNPIRVRPYQLIRSLVRRGHEVTLLTVWTQAEDKQDIRTLEEQGVRVVAYHLPSWRSLYNVFGTVLTDRPLQSAYCWQPRLGKTLGHLARSENFNIVHIEHLRGSIYGLRLCKERSHQNSPAEVDCVNRVPIVWDSVDSISHLYEQASQQSRSRKWKLMTQLELDRTRKYEARALDIFDQITVSSPVDREALLRLHKCLSRTSDRTITEESSVSPGDRLHVLPNGVDLEYFGPSAQAHDADTIVLTGKMSYHANVTAAMNLVQDIMPHVWARRPDTQVWIVGKDPASAVRDLASDRPRVTVTGTVPDMREYIGRATASVAPMLYGAGIQNKVLESMACQTAVVATSHAVSALDAEPDRDLLVADGAEAFASAILSLLASRGKQESIAAAGRRYVQEHHSWDAIGGRLESIYQRALDSLESPSNPSSQTKSAACLPA